MEHLVPFLIQDISLVEEEVVKTQILLMEALEVVVQMVVVMVVQLMGHQEMLLLELQILVVVAVDKVLVLNRVLEQADQV